ncbi:MAG TPA: TIGR02587 family membrane protein [Longimicrobium sp.]|nr:TIGR02587 family membrane protein [Longimicrobium sp.]
MTHATGAELDRRFFVGLARAFGGAVFFSLPLLMTMEMWWLGFYAERTRLLLFMLVMVPVLVVLDHYSGFQPTTTWAEDVEDGMIAYGVGLVTSFVVLFLFGIIDFTQPLREVVGKVAIQSVPASLGAVLATSQLAGDGQPEGPEEERKKEAGYWTEVFFMAAGALFLAFNVAPTEEMILISFVMTPWHGLALVVASLAMVHGFVYSSGFRGSPGVHGGASRGSLFLRYSVVGYTTALLVSAYVLWTFGRYEGGTFTSYLMMAVVLGLPASLGAAGARLIL